MKNAAVYYGKVRYGNEAESVLLSKNDIFICRGYIFNQFLGKQVRVTITELADDSQEEKIMAKVQELELAAVH